MKKLIIFSVMLVPIMAAAEEGMWTFDHPPIERMKKNLSWSPDSNWLLHIMRSSARLAFGCSGSFVSPNGLVLTNHHCAAQCLEQLSNDKVDHMATGYLAPTMGEEQRCPAMDVNSGVKMYQIAQ